MQRQYPLINIVLVGMFVVMLLITTILTWYTYVYKEDFRVVTNEAESPSNLDLSTY